MAVAPLAQFMMNTTRGELSIHTSCAARPLSDQFTQLISQDTGDKSKPVQMRKNEKDNNGGTNAVAAQLLPLDLCVRRHVTHPASSHPTAQPAPSRPASTGCAWIVLSPATRDPCLQLD